MKPPTEGQTAAATPLQLAVLLAGLAASACSSSNAGEPASGEDGSEPLYVVNTTVYDADGGRIVYFGLSSTLDIEEFSFDTAREQLGVSGALAVNGRLYISDGESPLITQYSVTDDFQWVERGKVSFNDYPLTDNANFFSQYMADEHAMYLPFDGSKRIVWDPTNLEIVKTMEDSQLEPMVGNLVLEPGGNRTGVVYDGPVMQPFFYHDEDWYEFGPTSKIAVYDPETHEERALIDAPCPGLAVPSQDEAGNTYFSTWDASPFFALYGAGPAPCVVRVSKDRQLDADFTTDMTQWTGGRYVMNFRYVRDGWGLADVLDHEELEADFTGEIDPALLDEIWDGGHFRLWRIDIERGQAEPYEDVGVAGYGWSSAKIDGRSFLFIPNEDWTRTKVFEVDAAGRATQRLDLLGQASWFRVR